MAKPVILTFVGYYLPGYKSGGPVQTIANMVERLGDELDFRIVTADRDLLDTRPYPEVMIDQWNPVGRAQVYYTSPKNRSLMGFTRLMGQTPYDVLYLNSFFSPGFTILPLLVRRLLLAPKRPTVVAPRGEFSAGALALKRGKKRLYLALKNLHNLYRGTVWHASSEYEAADIRKAMGSAADKIVVAIVVAPDLPSSTKFSPDQGLHDTTAPGESLRVCFFSRIVPKKNLEFALRVLASVKVPIEFSIYGTLEDKSYWQSCQRLIDKMPPQSLATYRGVIEHSDLVQVLSRQDLFFFPTLGENYGHVIHEALSCGLPILISDQTPWRNLESLGVGWDFPLSAPEKFRAVIEEQAAIHPEVRAKQRRLARNYARMTSEDSQTIADNLSLFMDLVSKKV